jgi:hypothetical protein
MHGNRLPKDIRGKVVLFVFFRNKGRVIRLLKNVTRLRNGAFQSAPYDSRYLSS